MKGTVIITGASRGIGAATARLAAARGYAVCVNYRAAKHQAEALVREIEASGVPALAVGADVAVEADVVRLFEALDLRLGEADYLAGDYSIADMAVFPWTRDRNAKWGGTWEQQFPNVWAWHARVKERPAVRRMVELCDRLVAEDAASIGSATIEIKDRFLGRGQFAAP